MRRALHDFLNGLGLERKTVDDIITAVGEVLANAVEHAYANGEGAIGSVELWARVPSQTTLAVYVADAGKFIERAPLPGRGFGLHIVKAIARKVDIDRSRGTRVHLTFDLTSSSRARKAE